MFVCVCQKKFPVGLGILRMSKVMHIPEKWPKYGLSCSLADYRGFSELQNVYVAKEFFCTVIRSPSSTTCIVLSLKTTLYVEITSYKSYK